MGAWCVPLSVSLSGQMSYCIEDNCPRNEILGKVQYIQDYEYENYDY